MCKLKNTEGVGGGGGRGSKSKRWSRAPRSLIIPYFPVSRPSSFAEFSRDAISVNKKTKIEVRGEHKTSWGGGGALRFALIMTLPLQWSCASLLVFKRGRRMSYQGTVSSRAFTDAQPTMNPVG